MDVQATNKCNKYRYNDQIANENGWFKEGRTCRNENLAKEILFKRFRHPDTYQHFPLN